MAPSDDAFALSRTEAILLDGANSVSGEPRAKFPSSALSSLAAGVALVVVFAWLRGRRPRWLLAALCLLAAAPGAWCVLSLRGDAPLARPQAAARLTQTLETLERVAPWPTTPVRIAHEDDDVLFPLGRYAWPSRPQPSGDAARLELRGDALEANCAPSAARSAIVCGAEVTP